MKRGECYYCGSIGPLTRDHVIPQCRGLKGLKNNIVLACRYCNKSKGSKTLAAWYKWTKELNLHPASAKEWRLNQIIKLMESH